jgi:segregation and condensation protein B
MGLKAKIEAIIYAAEEPITLEQISLLVRDVALAEEAPGKAGADSALENKPLEVVAAPGTDSAPASETSEPTEPAPTDAALSGTVISEPDESTAEAEAAPAEVAMQAEPEPQQVSVTAKAAVAGGPRKAANPEDARIRLRVRAMVEELIADYASEDRGMEIRQVAGGYRMATKPQHHDVVRAFARSLKPPVRLSIAALETLAVIAYKQPVTAPEISEIRGVESAGVLGTLLDRKLITTAGRKQVIGRPILYKTTKQFLLRFGLNELSELPSMEEFEKLALDGQVDLFAASTASTAATAAPVGDPEPETQVSEEPGAAAAVEAPSGETSTAASAEPPASSSPVASEQPSAMQTAEKAEPDGAPIDSTEEDRG